MKELRIYFKNNELTSINWCYLVAGIKTESGTKLNDLFVECAHSSVNTVLIVPQFWLYETSLDISAKSGKQILSAAAYQLEEQIAEDVDSLHFAQGPVNGNHVPFIVIKHDKMERLIEFEKSHSLNVSAIVAEIALCSEPNHGEVNVIQHEHHYLFKASDIGINSVCSHQQLGFFIQHYQIQYPDALIKQLEKKELLCHTVNFSNCINLKQKEYSQEYAWHEKIKTFALPVTLLLTLAVLLVLNQWQENQQLLDNIDSVKSKQSDILKTSINVYPTSLKAKTALIKALQKQQKGQNKNGFISDFHQFLNAKKELKLIVLNKVNYRNKRLSIDVTANNLQQLDQLIVLMKKNFTVTVSQMDSSNSKSQGRFILERK